MKTTRRIREPKVRRLAKAIDMPQSQIDRGDYEACDVANRTDADQRHSVRSEQTRTIRKKTKLQKLKDAGIINSRELSACEWYQSTYEEHYETRVRIADWSATGGASDRAYGHWPAGVVLEPGMNMIEFARQGISPAVLPMFDRVVLHGRPLGKLAITFRTAARKLLEQIEGMVAL